MTWWMFALGAALTWGVHYVLLGRALTAVSPITMYYLPSLPLLIVLPFYYKHLVRDYHTLMASTMDVKVCAFIATFTSLIGAIFLYKAIHSSNATYASLIEIAYPFFVVVASWLIFGESHLSVPVIVGGLLVMLGTGIIIYSNG